MEHDNEHDVVDDEEEGREDNVLDEEDNLSDEDIIMPFDDDDNMSDETNSDEGSDDDSFNYDDLVLLEQNDPDLLNFVIRYTYRPPDDMEAFGESIGRNAYLKELVEIRIRSIHDEAPYLGRRFFPGLLKNRSIQKLHLYCSDLQCDELTFLYLIPFFMNNKAFESLDITCVNESAVPGVGHFDSLVYALEQFNGLKELTMFKMMDNLRGQTKSYKHSLAILV
jgi:hypothetical protein